MKRNPAPDMTFPAGEGVSAGHVGGASGSEKTSETGASRQPSLVGGGGSPAEPSPQSLNNPFKRYVFATRPAFLTITLAGCLLGFASATPAGFSWALALATLALAALAHAGVNVFNDYYDHLNGSDAANTERLFPFTGGSRFIQNGVMSPRHTLVYAVMLFLAVIAGGLGLIQLRGEGLFWIGLIGLLTGWAYSAPPLKLNSRGLGEVCVMLGFLLIVVGADFVQRGALALAPWQIGLPYALLVTNILYINQFPDRAADLHAGKLHWVARLNPHTAARGYVVILALAAGAQIGLTLSGAVSVWTLPVLLAWLPGLRAARLLLANAARPAVLAPAIQMTLATAHLQPLLMALALALLGSPA